MCLFRDLTLVFAPALLLTQISSSDGPAHGRFHPPAGVLVSGLRETATHRNTIKLLRIASDHGMPAEASFWVHLDASGRVLEVRDIQMEDYAHPRMDEAALFEAMRQVKYEPFTQDGKPVEAWVQDSVGILSREESRPPSKQGAKTFPDPDPSTNFSITLSRSACFGTCPSYSVTVHGDGTVKYEGNSFVSIEGQHTAEIAPEAAQALFDRFREANFFGLKDEYVAGVTDNPTYRLTVAVGLKKKSVTDYVGEWEGMPAVVSELEEAVDEVADSARWVTASSQTLEAMREAGIAPSSLEATRILHRAVAEGKAGAVRELLALGVPTDVENKPEGWWPSTGSLLDDVTYYRADARSRRDTVAALLESQAVREDKKSIQNALGNAVIEGQTQIAQMLISAGADPKGLFGDRYNADRPADQMYLMRAVQSGVWSMIDDALSRPHNVHAVDHEGRSALSMVIWTSPPREDIFPILDKLIADGAGKKELDRALLDACDRDEWRDGLIARGASPTVCADPKK